MGQAARVQGGDVLPSFLSAVRGRAGDPPGLIRDRRRRPGDEKPDDVRHRRTEHEARDRRSQGLVRGGIPIPSAPEGSAGTPRRRPARAARRGVRSRLLLARSSGLSLREGSRLAKGVLGGQTRRQRRARPSRD